MLLATGEGASSMSLEGLTISLATPILGPRGPGRGWAHGARSHHLGGALDSCRLWPGEGAEEARITVSPPMVKDATSPSSLAQVTLR